MKPSTLNKYLADLTPTTTGLRLCTGCMCERPADEFVARRSNRTTRWLCQSCQQRASESWVTRGRKGQSPAKE